MYMCMGIPDRVTGWSLMSCSISSNWIFSRVFRILNGVYLSTMNFVSFLFRLLTSFA